MALLAIASAFGHDVITTKLTYTRDISRIFAKRCTACHAAGSSIPLTNYAEVRPWAVDIKQQVLGRQMPPWGAVKGFGDLAHDEGLTQEEVLVIAAWVIGGAPEGDPKLLPKPAKPAVATTAHEWQQGLRVNSETQLDRALRVGAIRPLDEGEIASSRITARLPDGRTEPLLWLFHYDGKWKRTFEFREPVSLPRGTVIAASAPLAFELEGAP